ncbi:hypothetical protein [Candidatus Cryosericum septentrionale]|uniref:Uncharacterized protein n=1 Tax=Candidatus Cryosericum septentrionale TaxID=2290913 RepID=A0A398DJU8_9BACT|nr:hypothetical protein [Candidatus Cryosericum septentrionale]RIE15946.1 hypothetical protein SMC1_09050 [Candidatus Cryosericum septentrionale]
MAGFPFRHAWTPPLDIPSVPPWTWWVAAAVHDGEPVLLVIVRFWLETEGLPELFEQAALILAGQLETLLSSPELRSLDP